jgi:allophanate hydrolase subunit 2
VLGSRSTDTLADLGPQRLAAGSRLAIGASRGEPPGVDIAPIAAPLSDPVLRLLPGPRADWFSDDALAALLGTAWEVTADSDRVGMRLDGPPLERRPQFSDRELPSEGTVEGALQVPPDGRPVLFLADHPVTGGYPVVAVVAEDDVAAAAQVRPGGRLRFRR